MYINIAVEKMNDVKVLPPMIKKGEWSVRVNEIAELTFRSREDLENFIDEIQNVLVYTNKEAV